MIEPHLFCDDGPPISIEHLLDGHTLAGRFDPEFSDLNWSAVGTIGYILDEYYPGELWIQASPPLQQSMTCTLA